MPQMITDLFKGQAIGDESRRAGVAQCMRPTVGSLDSEGFKPATDNIIDAAASNRTPRCVHSQKDARKGRSWADRINVACQRLGHGRDKRST